MTNSEGYADPTADLAVGRVSRWELGAQMKRKALNDMAKIQQYAETLGWRVQGSFQLWHRESRKRVDILDWK